MWQLRGMVICKGRVTVHEGNTCCNRIVLRECLIFNWILERKKGEKNCVCLAIYGVVRKVLLIQVCQNCTNDNC